ncbi:hypothetical protein DFH09DRAFT_1081138 [Mycena vulgaris]|nr:hypothetical protein DFH09DRAFT_1081138 [Mycena vulgaris]
MGWRQRTTARLGIDATAPDVDKSSGQMESKESRSTPRPRVRFSSPLETHDTALIAVHGSSVEMDEDGCHSDATSPSPPMEMYEESDSESATDTDDTDLDVDESSAGSNRSTHPSRPQCIYFFVGSSGPQDPEIRRTLCPEASFVGVEEFTQLEMARPPTGTKMQRAYTVCIAILVNGRVYLRRLEVNLKRADLASGETLIRIEVVYKQAIGVRKNKIPFHFNFHLFRNAGSASGDGVGLTRRENIAGQPDFGGGGHGAATFGGGNTGGGGGGGRCGAVAFGGCGLGALIWLAPAARDRLAVL